MRPEVRKSVTNVGLRVRTACRFLPLASSVQRSDRPRMNSVRCVADNRLRIAPVCLRFEMALLVLFAFVCLASAAPQQQATRSIVIDLSVVDDKGQAVPQARIEISAQGQLLAVELSDAAGRTATTLQR